MTLASIHYMRTHYQEAIDVYKRLLMENRELIAINVFVALCYYRLEYYDVSQEVLAPYLQLYPTSFIALNLKACVQYKLYNGHAAEEELKPLTELMHAASGSSKGGLVNFFGEEVIKHNLVVFRGGEGALQNLPALVDIVPEARVNLVIYHLKHEDVMAAYDLLKDVEPLNPIASL
jgi:intraflagellar transport protein 56